MCAQTTLFIWEQTYLQSVLQTLREMLLKHSKCSITMNMHHSFYFAEDFGTYASLPGVLGIFVLEMSLINYPLHLHSIFHLRISRFVYKFSSSTIVFEEVKG